MEEKVKALIKSGHTISTMESCTGGLLASAITDCSGASEIMAGGYVTYSNRAKIACGVPASCIEAFGVYSKETSAAMAMACAKAFHTDIGVGITGSLGRKDPRNPDSVSGKVFYSIYTKEAVISAILTVPDEITHRHKMKEYVVNAVLDAIIQKIVNRK